MQCHNKDAIKTLKKDSGYLVADRSSTGNIRNKNC